MRSPRMPLTARRPSKRTASTGAAAVATPRWLRFDRNVLKFHAYFKEAVNESDAENFRVRRCDILLYLEDGSLQVLEPREENSGLPQGAFIKRHKIKKAGVSGGLDAPLVSEDDLRVGGEVTLYSRVFKIVDCDAHTRAFYEREKRVTMDDALPYPDDPYTARRAQQDVANRENRPVRMDSAAAKARGDEVRAAGRGAGVGGGGDYFYGKKKNPLKRFMEATLGNPVDRQRHGVQLHGGRAQFTAAQGKVLRFFCCCDDSDVYGGSVQWLKLHYYLVDNTLDVAAADGAARNSGRDPCPLVVRRSRVPRDARLYTQDPRVNGVEEPAGGSASVRQQYLQATDLRLGTTVNVFGRQLTLCAADAFTLAWFRDTHGIDMSGDAMARPPSPDATSGRNGAGAAAAITGGAPQSRRRVPFTPPPYNGFGSEEDSLASCLRIITKPPRQDVMKRLNNEGRNLRFTACLEDGTGGAPRDGERRFVITFYTSDDSFSVYAPRTQNSGIVEGKFLQRQRMRRPQDGQYYGLEDLRVGAQLRFHSRVFRLLSADEFTLKFFEADPATFPLCDPAQVLQRLKKRLAACASAAGGSGGDAASELLRQHLGTRNLSPERFVEKMGGVPGLQLQQQELITLSRAFKDGDAVCCADLCDAVWA